MTHQPAPAALRGWSEPGAASRVVGASEKIPTLAYDLLRRIGRDLGRPDLRL